MTAAAQFETLDPNDLDMHLTKSGVRVSQVGEDGDVLLIGHHDDATAWSLYAEWTGYYDGIEVTLDDAKVYDIKRRFASFSNHSEACELIDCQCPERACTSCLAGKHDECTDKDCECADDWDHDHPGTSSCFCECYCDEFAWWVNETKSGHEVTWVRYSPVKAKALMATKIATQEDLR